MSESDGGKKKVDESWKDEVAKEKQEAQPESPREEPEPQAPPLPPASFPTLVNQLGVQAAMLLHGMPEVEGGEPVPHPEEAKHLIDLLAVLQDKTRGNLTETEANLLENALYELRMAFVDATKAGR